MFILLFIYYMLCYSTYMYVCMYVCMYVYIYIYIYILLYNLCAVFSVLLFGVLRLDAVVRVREGAIAPVAVAVDEPELRTPVGSQCRGPY